MQFYLGAEDIARIVKAILPALEKYLSNKTKDEQYVYLTTLVNLYSKDKTYGNKTELNNLVKDISSKVGKVVIVPSTSVGSCGSVVPGLVCSDKDGYPQDCATLQVCKATFFCENAYRCVYNQTNNAGGGYCYTGPEC